MLAVSGPTVWLPPPAALLPLQPPLATQLVALMLDQLRRLVPPLLTLVGVAASDIVGAGAGGCVTVTDVEFDAEPPLPEQVSV